MTRPWIAVVAAGLVALTLTAGGVTAADPTMLHVTVFRGPQNLPIFVGQEKGFFAKRGLKIDLNFTPNSAALRDGLAKGTYDIAHAAVDNAVAMVELAGADTIIVLGGDNSMNHLIVQPDVKSVADLRGKTVIVDAPNTAYALQAKKILLMHGLKAGQDYTVKPTGGTSERIELMRQHKDYAATMLYPPYSILAERAGMRSLGLYVKLVGPYQANGAFVMRKWASAHATTLERYIQAYVESLRWAFSPANKNDAVALLTERLKIPADVATRTYDESADPVGGVARDARFDMEGFKHVLALRAEIEGQWGGKPPAPEKYVDGSYYERALVALGR